MPNAKHLIPVEVIENKILLLRGKKVMLGKELAVLYGVLNKNLNKAVKRNLKRFPADFMFQLTKAEFKNLKFQIGTSSWGGERKLPYAFTEHGVLMLSSVLNSERAVQVNIQIMRAFIKLRKIMLTHKNLQQKIQTLERKYDQKFSAVFDAIKQLLRNDALINKRLTYEEDKQKNKKWGFVPNNPPGQQ
ncbi:MAG: ORF6N domain-containing protein [Candidatus Margulisbacteria bacterium]|jgi:hypothetical protein|nr:ORF6N domain-containing protein [Candidatus Margulisiibacteriota bacterium]